MVVNKSIPKGNWIGEEWAFLLTLSPEKGERCGGVGGGMILDEGADFLPSPSGKGMGRGFLSRILLAVDEVFGFEDIYA